MSEVREISPEDAKYIDPTQVTSMQLSDGTTVVVKREEEMGGCPIHSRRQQRQETYTEERAFCGCPIHSSQQRQETTTTYQENYRARAAPAMETYQSQTTTTEERGNYAGVVEDRRNYRLYESGVTNSRRDQEEECTCNCNICPCCGKIKRTTEFQEEVLRAPAPRVTQTQTRTTYQTQTAPLRTSQTKTFISEYVQPKYVYADTTTTTTGVCPRCGKVH